MLRPDQRRIFMLSLAITLSIAVGAYVVGTPEWLARFVLATVPIQAGFFALAVMLRGVTEKSVAPFVPFMALLKIASYIGLFLAVRFTGFELSSFMAALSVFFVAISLHQASAMMAMHVQGEARKDAAAAAGTTPTDRPAVHG